MAFDAPTMLTLTIAIAAVAALYLMLEWRSVREPALLYWSNGFAAVAVGSTLALLRGSGLFWLGVWFANGLLVVSHWLFLLGVLRFAGERLSRYWYLVFAVWCTLLLLPAGPASSKIFLIVNSLLVAVLSLGASAVLRLHGELASSGKRQLQLVLLFHGLFYAAKAGLAMIPGMLINLVNFYGLVIQISLVEGVMAILLIALSMTGTVRHRRERRIEQLAERDPLTGLFNRRALEAHALRLLAQVSDEKPGALLLIDIDNFKLVNDLHGHAAGDRLLVTLSELIRSMLPDGALAARLGGDEFAILLGNVSKESAVRFGDELCARFSDAAAQAFVTPAAATLSIGAMVFDYVPDELNALIGRGDVALYEAKRGGRNRLQMLETGSADEACAHGSPAVWSD